jgi:hypothetical protein
MLPPRIKRGIKLPEGIILERARIWRKNKEMVIMRIRV